MRKVALSVPFILIGLAVWTLTGGAADADRDWPAYAGDKGSTKYSPLEQINKDTIKNLRVAWTRSGLPEELRPTFPDAQAAANYQHTPLVVGGVMYMSSAVGAVGRRGPPRRGSRRRASRGGTTAFHFARRGRARRAAGPRGASRTGPMDATRAS